MFCALDGNTNGDREERTKTKGFEKCKGDILEGAQPKLFKISLLKFKLDFFLRKPLKTPI